MQKQTILLITTLFLAITLCGAVNAAGDEIWISDADGSDTTGDGSQTNPYQTLYKGINETNDKGVLHVLNGTYTGSNNTNLPIENNISIIGQNQLNTIIDGENNDWIFDIHGSGLVVLFANLTLQNAKIDYDGGAAIYSDEGSTVIVSGCRFLNNEATDENGGAIYNEGGNLTVTDSYFENNEARTEYDDDLAGGAIYNEDGTLVVINSDFYSNLVYSEDGNGYGGAIYNEYGTLTVTNCNFTSNYVDSYDSGCGGAIYSQYGNFTVTDSYFEDNYVDCEDQNAYGGAIYNYDGDLIVTNSDFIDNEAYSDEDYGYGGAIYNDECTITVTDSYFEDNSAESYDEDGYGGAIYTDGDSTLTNTDFIDNFADYHGGAFYNDYYVTATITDCDFEDNDASDAGAIWNDGDLIINNCKFLKNNAEDAGGAIFHCDGTLNVTDSAFNNNTAYDGDGGAICIDSDTTANISYSDFIRNSADDDGGAICSECDELTVIGCNFVNNTADGEGGAFYNDGTDYTLNFNRILNNTADSGNDISDDNVDSQDIHNALYNWWGSNAGPAAGRIAGELVEYDPWLVMRYSASPLVIPQGSSSTLAADFRYDFDGTFHDPTLGHLPDNLPVNFTTTLGNVGSKWAIAYTLNGIATIPLRGDEAAGYALNSAIFDLERLYATVQITAVSVNAASNIASSTRTVGMQTTGAPLAGIVLAILMVLGGFISTRKQ